MTKEASITKALHWNEELHLLSAHEWHWQADEEPHQVSERVEEARYLAFVAFAPEPLAL